MGEDDNRGGGVNIEVEELNGGADERGDDDFITRVNRRGVLRVVDSSGCGLHRSFLFLSERKAI